MSNLKPCPMCKEEFTPIDDFPFCWDCFPWPDERGGEYDTWEEKVSAGYKRLNEALICKNAVQDAEVKRLRSALERIADPKSLDCANWLTIDQIREFAREALKEGE